jgi:uncharacterized protein YqeY
VSIQSRLQEDLKVAMKSGEVVTRDTLRLALAALKNRRIETGEDLSEGDELAVLSKEVKKRHDSAEQYEAASRPELAASERAEIEVLQRYLPQQLNEDETRTIVREVIESLGLSSKKEMGQVMKAVMAEHKGKIDGKLVQRIASELLG